MGILQEYQKAHTPTEDIKMKKKIMELCIRFDSIVAFNAIVINMVNLIINLQNVQKYGGGIYSQTISLETGVKSEVSRQPQPDEAYQLTIDMLNSLHKDILRQCKDFKDHNVAPGKNDMNYFKFLNEIKI